MEKLSFCRTNKFMFKRICIITAICVIGVLMGKQVFNLLHHPYAPQIAGEAVWCVDTHEKLLALTIDDGPSAVYTPQILDLLDQYQAQATFFVVGMNVEEHADLIIDLYTSGNEIGNHAWSHPRLSFRSAEFIRQQIQQTDQAIRDTGYEGNIPFRAPYGAKFVMLPFILNQSERANVLWNVDTKDWVDPYIAKSAGSLDVELSSGDIILMHISGKEDTIDWIEMILEEYTAQGYRFTTVSELMSYQQNDFPSSFNCVYDGVPGNLFSNVQTNH